MIVCNHIGPIDPSFIALATDQIVHWMVAKEYCVHPAMSWFFNTMQAIPVNRRGVDTAATKLAIRYAAQGDLVGFFRKDESTIPAPCCCRAGRGRLDCAKARVPVVPCYLRGAPNDGTARGPSSCRPRPACESESRSIFPHSTAAKGIKKSSKS